MSFLTEETLEVIGLTLFATTLLKNLQHYFNGADAAVHTPAMAG